MLEERIQQLIDLPDTYIGEAPIAVDNCQWIGATGGSSDTYFTKEAYDRPAFSIYVRDTSNAEAARRAKELFKKIRSTTDSIGAIIARRLPSFVGKDDQHRSVYVFSIEYQTGGY